MSDEISGIVESLMGPYGDSFYIMTVGSGLFDQVTVTGSFSNPEVGDSLKFSGEWKTHPRYGRQFHAKTAAMVVPKGARGVRLYLANKFPFVGDVIAERLHDRFGDTLFDVIDKDPMRLVEIRGISIDRATKISEKYKEICRSKETDIFFSTHGLSSKAVATLVECYGSTENVVKKIRENPYRLIEDVKGVGWKKADAIANSLSIPRNHPYRIRSGIIHALTESQLSGHCYLPIGELLKAAQKLLGCAEDIVMTEVEKLKEKGSIVVCDNEAGGRCCYPLDMYGAEVGVARILKVLVAGEGAWK